MNVIAFVTYGADKQKAKRQQWRVPENVLIALAALGGSVGAWAAMYLFHHKTRKSKFSIGVPLILALQILTVCLAYFAYMMIVGR